MERAYSFSSLSVSAAGTARRSYHARTIMVPHAREASSAKCLKSWAEQFTHRANSGSVVAAASARSMQIGSSFAGELTVMLTG